MEHTNCSVGRMAGAEGEDAKSTEHFARPHRSYEGQSAQKRRVRKESCVASVEQRGDKKAVPDSSRRVLVGGSRDLRGLSRGLFALLHAYFHEAQLLCGLRGVREARIRRCRLRVLFEEQDGADAFLPSTLEEQIVELQDGVVGVEPLRTH